MVTLAFILVFTILTILLGAIDILFFHKSINEFIQQVLSIQFGTRKWWVITGVLLGFIYSIIVDYKEYKGKKGVTEGT
jgi:hypothetical protein